MPDQDALFSVRERTEELAAPLSAEDQTVQSMPDASPTKWHRAHTTWFFEEFVLGGFVDGYEPFDPSYRFLFNSYYEAVGPRHSRPDRGLLSRPGIAEIRQFRESVDKHLAELLDRGIDDEAEFLVELGMHHEQQHQELLLMDIKHVLSVNPLRPPYRPIRQRSTQASPLHWRPVDGGVVTIGHDGDGFAYDNEGPRHEVKLQPYELASRTVTCGEYLEFMADGGYERPEFWLSDGWGTVQEGGWRAPSYWREENGQWHVFTLGGKREVVEAEPVCHLSYYEADAYATWAGARLPTEQEWEHAVESVPTDGCDLDDLHPTVADGDTLEDSVGQVWEWTSSAYAPYPGFTPEPGAVGEYNGKFMVNQQVLRGGACVTPPDHARLTYRNFFPAAARWPFTGVRLARDLEG